MKLIYLFPNDFATKSANRIQTLNFAYALDNQLSDNFLFISGSGYTQDVLNGLGINEKSKNHIEIDFTYKKGITIQFVYKLFQLGIFKANNNILYMRDYKLLLILSKLKKYGLVKNQLIFELHEVPELKILNALKSVDKLVCISKAIYEDLPVSLQNKPYSIAHDGFNSHHLESQDNSLIDFDEGKTILYIGTYQEWKNIEYIVKLAKILKEVNFLLIGIEKEKIKESMDHDLSNINFIDYVEHKEIYKILQKTKYAIYTLNPKFSIAKYTSPLKLFEYLSFGITVFAPNYLSIKEVLEDKKNAYLYDMDDIDKTAKLIKNIINNNQILDKNKVQKSIKQYSWDERARKVKSFVQS